MKKALFGLLLIFGFVSASANDINNATTLTLTYSLASNTVSFHPTPNQITHANSLNEANTASAKKGIPTNSVPPSAIKPPPQTSNIELFLNTLQGEGIDNGKSNDEGGP